MSLRLPILGHGTLSQRVYFVKHSGPRFAKSTWAACLIAVVTGVSGCSPKAPSGNRYQLPWFNDDGSYQLQTVTLQTYSEPQHFRGESAEVLVQPNDSTGKIAGEKPNGRYIRRSDGVIVPADETSLAATTIYAHFERLREIDMGMGIQLKWPATVGIDVKMTDNGQPARDNALYDGRYDAFLVLPADKVTLPLTMNGGVIAHEHFHGVFQTMVLNSVRNLLRSEDISFLYDCSWITEKQVVNFDEILEETREKRRDGRLEETPSTNYNSFLLRGMNEGFADFWAWVYTGDDDFLEKSLPGEASDRTMAKPTEKLFSISELKDILATLEGRHDKMYQRAAWSYNIGTRYARFMRAAATKLSGKKVLDKEQRLNVARSFIDVLPDFRAHVVSKYSKEPISPDAILDFLSQRWSKKNPELCDALNGFSSSGKTSGCKP